MSNLFWLDDESWLAIEPLIPIHRPGVKPGRNRKVISGIIHVLKVGCRWSDCPPGPRSGGDRLQPVQPLVQSGRLASSRTQPGSGSIRSTRRPTRGGTSSNGRSPASRTGGAWPFVTINWPGTLPLQ